VDLYIHSPTRLHGLVPYIPIWLWFILRLFHLLDYVDDRMIDEVEKI
jgi:hypothetical protein